MTQRDRMLAMFLAIGSAHAGEPLTHEDLLHRLETDPDFMRRFNGPPPPEVEFHDEETAALAAAWQNAAKRLP
jgi:3-oxoacyl-[acyl-carrier-protein] synthase III